MSRMACACSSDRPNSRTRPSRASGGFFGGADQRDHGIELVEGDLQALEDVRARLRLPQLELGAPADDVAAEVDEVLEQLDERQDARPAGDDGQHDDGEGGLQRGVLVEIVEHDLRHFTALELDHDPHAVAVGLVAQIGDALDHLLPGELGDLLEQLRLVHLIGNLGDDDRRSCRPALPRTCISPRTDDRAAAGGVGIEHAAPADDGRRRWGSPAPARAAARGGACLRATPPARRRRAPAARSISRLERVDDFAADCAAGCWSPSRRRCRPSR